MDTVPNDAAEVDGAPGSTVSLIPHKSAADAAPLWEELRRKQRPAGETARPAAALEPSVMETNVSVIASLPDAPPRTVHSAPIVRSSPLPPAVRAMLERREFGRRFDFPAIDVEAIADRLPRLACPRGDVQFLANDRSFEDLELSVTGLLQHRKRLLSASLDANRPRRHALVVGAGPGGLMAAVQLRLRDHHVVVCEARDTYSRNRYIGVYKEVTHLMAALGMPESMTYDFSQYRGKRGIMLADIQTFLHAIALKLGVVIYTGAVCRTLSSHVLQSGEVELQRAATGTSAPDQSSVGITRWQHDTIARVRSGVAIRFDLIVEATGGRSGLRELLVGPDNIVSMRTLARAAASRDPSLESFFADPEDHCAEYVESGYGCAPGLRQSFAAALLSSDTGEIPDALPCFVSNIDASVFMKPMTATPGSMGLASRVGDRTLDIPHDWVVLQCRLADQSLSRYHIEGPLPQTFEFGGTRVSTRETLPRINPVSLLLRILYAMGVPFDAVDRRKLVDFYDSESSSADASDIVSTWVGSFRGLRLGGDQPIWCGKVPGSNTIEYAIIGEALQNAWYRFGVGVDDTFAAAVRLAEGLELDPAQRVSEIQRFERVMTARSVQVVYHLYSVARNTDQGVVGSVLTEYYMDEQHGTDLAEARFRDVTRQGAEMLAAATDVRSNGGDALLDAAMDHLRESCCQRALALLDAFGYPSDVAAGARQAMNSGDPDWRARTFATLAPALSPAHRDMLIPLFGAAEAPDPTDAERKRRRDERLVELGLGRYGWTTPWVRACALRVLDPAAPAAAAALERAAADRDPLIAETATAALAKTRAGTRAAVGDRDRYLTVDKVMVLKDVNLFRALPHEVLAGVATLLTDRWVDANERVFNKGDFGDSLYIIASGRVRVHDDERTLQHLGPRDVFGELSLLDAQPRSASVSAVEPTHLFRLAQADFYALMSERTDLMQAINRALCGMVRAANALVTR